MKSPIRSMLVTLSLLALCCLPATLITSCATTSDSGEDKPLSAEDVINNYVEATGGRDAYEKITSLVTKGVLEMPAIGLSMTATISAQAPNLLLTVMTSDAIGTAANGTNGEIYWENTMMTGARILEGEEKASSVRDATFNLWLRWREIYKQATITGIEAVSEQQCHVVEMIPKEGQPATLYFAKDSGLLVRMKMAVTTEMGRITIDSTLSDYREVDGVKFAFHTRQIMMDIQEMIMKIESVETNVTIPDGTFDLPAEIQALLDN